MKVVNAQIHTHKESQTLRLPLKEKYYIGRDTSRCDLAIPATWHACSRHQAVLQWIDGRWWLKDGMDGKASSNGTFNADGDSAAAGLSLGIGPNLRFRIGSHSVDHISVELQGLSVKSTAQVKVAVKKIAEITLGRSPDCDICIDDPSISRLHAVIRPHGDGSAVVDDRSSNGLTIQGRKAGVLTRISAGTQIQLGRAKFRWTGDKLESAGDHKLYGIEVRSLVLPNRLHDVSLSIPGGQLVALVGGSGAGKSSLLTTLAGQNPNYQGAITISSEDLRQAIGALRPLMGFVPQDDIVHTNLTVREVLHFAARLRLPDREEQRKAVDRVLNLLEIEHRRDALVKQLSGGQRKRVSIGMELVADPRILFLDEPTSGLDPGLDRKMMKLLRQLADNGHTVVVVTHATGNVTLCDQVVFLGRGGHLCYSGSPQQCLHFFGGVKEFAEVYELLDQTELVIQKKAQSFKQNHLLPPLSKCDADIPSHVRHLSSSPIRNFQSFLSQVRTLLKREVMISRRDRTATTLNMLTAPVAIMLLAAAIQNRNVFTIPVAGVTADLLPSAIKVVFVISCACIWTGISTHIASVAKEKAIYGRERAFNLMPLAYTSSKIMFLSIMALPQALLITVVVAFLFKLPTDLAIGNSLLGYFWSAFLTILASGSLAIFLSAIVKDQRQASSSSPLLLMPQLIFSGVLFDIGNLSLLFPFIASRWSVKLFGAFSGIESLKFTSQVPGIKLIDASPYLSSYSNVLSSSGWLVLEFCGFALLAYLLLSRRRGLPG